MEKAMFGAGCFWGVEDAFRRTNGVIDVVVGYAGGNTERPTYEQVCTGNTGHAEVVEVTFDPAKVTYEKLLDRFWEIHDPTQMNRQGPDVGYQYRSVVYTYTQEQREIAEASRARLAASGVHASPIMTTIEPAPPFWRAEEYHQNYVQKTGRGACHV